MAKGKIDYHQLQEWLDEGLSQAEIAKHFGVNPSSVHKAIKRHKLAIAKVVTASEATPIIVQRKIDILKQIKSINETMNAELNWIKEKINGNGKDAIDDPKERALLQDQMVKFVGEVRKQMNTLLDVAKTLYNAEETQAFQRIVLEAIERADPGTKEKIIQALHEVRSVGRLIEAPEILE